MLRDYTPADADAVLALNAADVAVLSPLDADALAALAAQAAYFRVGCTDGQVAAFLLALREGADYASPNYRWFAERYPRFVYVDRIVVAPAARGTGLGATLYTDLFASARAGGLEAITCEYDIDPPNPASARFHARFGFAEVGRQRVAGGRKEVSLQMARVNREG
jgi:predicted GNAT superfamily acetyltransferase